MTHKYLKRNNMLSVFVLISLIQTHLGDTSKCIKSEKSVMYFIFLLRKYY